MTPPCTTIDGAAYAAAPFPYARRPDAARLGHSQAPAAEATQPPRSTAGIATACETGRMAASDGPNRAAIRPVSQGHTALLAKLLAASWLAADARLVCNCRRGTQKSPCICLCGVSSPPQTHGLPGLNSDYKEKSKYYMPLCRTYPMLSQKAGSRQTRNTVSIFSKVLIDVSTARCKDTKNISNRHICL